ncbi:MAG: hypothetical protein ABUL58_08410 [Steroidobacter sp.]
MPLMFVALAVFIFHSAQTRAHDSGLNGKQIKPGFNCAKGHSRNEQMICNDAELSRIDYELSLLHAQARLLTHNSPSFKKTNNEEWLWREKNCHDKNCLLQWYANRHTQLAAVLSQHGDAFSMSSASGASTSSASSIPPPESGVTETPGDQQTTLSPAQSTQTISQQMITLPLIRKPLFWIIAIGVVILISLGWEMLGTDQQTRRRRRLIALAVNSNISEFMEQHSRTVHSGEAHDIKKWDKEKRQFIDEMVKPALTDCTPLSISELDRLCTIIDYIAWGIKKSNSQYKFRGDLDEACSHDYLQFCARILKHHGWKTRTARASGCANCNRCQLALKHCAKHAHCRKNTKPEKP